MEIGHFWGGGFFGNFGFGLRRKSWKIGNFWGGSLETSDLDLGEKVGNWSFLGGGGSLETSDLDLGEKVGNWSFLGGGVLWKGGSLDFGFGLRRKSWKLVIFGGYSGGFGLRGGSLETSDLDLGEKVGNWSFLGGGGVLWKLRIWT